MTVTAEWIAEVCSDGSGFNDTPTWIDVSSRIRSDLGEVAISRGTDSELNKRAAGQITSIVFDNRDGQLSPESGSALAACFTAGQRIRLRGRYPAVTGTIYPQIDAKMLTPVFDGSAQDAWVTVTAADDLARLAGQNLVSTFFEMQARAQPSLRAWWPLADKTDSTTNKRSSLLDIGPNQFSGFYVNAVPYVDLDDPVFPFEQSTVAGATDFAQGNPLPTGYNPVSGAYNYAVAADTLMPVGLGSGPGNMADLSHRITGLSNPIGSTVNSSVPAGTVGGSFTIAFTIQKQRLAWQFGHPLFTQNDPNFGNQLVFNAWVCGTNDTTTPGQLKFYMLNVGIWTVPGHLDDGLPHRIVITYDAAIGVTYCYVNGVLKLLGSPQSSGVYATRQFVIGGWTYTNSGTSTTYSGSGLAMGNVMLFDDVFSSSAAAADYEAAAAPGAGDNCGDRIARMLTAVGVPSSFQNIHSGASPAAPSGLAVGTGGSDESTTGNYQSATTILDYCQIAETTEVGAFFIDKAGLHTFLGRNDFGAGPGLISAGLFGDRPDNGEIPYTTISLGPDQNNIRNYLQSTRVDGVEQILTDPSSVQEFGEQDLQEDSLLLYTDRDVLRRQQLLLTLYANPPLTVLSIEVDPGDNEGAWRLLLSLEEMDRVSVIRRNPDGTTLVAQDVLVTQIDLKSKRGAGWIWKLTLDAALAASWLVLDDPVHGTLDSGNLLAW